MLDPTGTDIPFIGAVATAATEEPFTKDEPTNCLTRFGYSTDSTGFTGADFWVNPIATQPTPTSAEPLQVLVVGSVGTYGLPIQPQSGKYVSKIGTDCSVGGNKIGTGYWTTDAATGAHAPMYPGLECNNIAWDGQTTPDCIKTFDANLDPATKAIDWIKFTTRGGTSKVMVGTEGSPPSTISFEGGAALAGDNGCAISILPVDYNGGLVSFTSVF